MQFYNHFPFIIIMLPLTVSVVMGLVRNVRIARSITLAVQVVIILFSLWLLVSLLNAPVESFVYSMGHFPAPWGNELRAGPLEAIMSCTFALVMFFSILGGARDAVLDIKSENIKYYHLMINLLTTSLMALVYTNDIFTGYVFIEINTLAACAIVVAKENGETIKATIKYLTMSVLGSSLFLLSTSILYSITGHLLMEPAHQVISDLSNTGQYHVPLIMTLVLYSVSLAIKSALFPFHSWLPDAHGYATTTSSAVLSGLVLKGYIVLLIKLIFRVYGIDVVSTFGITFALFALGLSSMIAGSILALNQKDIKRMIAYSSVAQIGYIFMGIGLNTTEGLTAACYQIIAHAFTKSMLFIAAGVFIKMAGSKNISDMVGVARKNKIAGIAFAVGALSMIGVPLFAGFPSKFYLANAAMHSSYGTVIAVIVLALSTFLNALYYIPTVLKIYSNKDNQESTLKVKSMSIEEGKLKSLISPTLICLIFANIALGIFYVPLLSVIEQGFIYLR